MKDEQDRFEEVRATAERLAAVEEEADQLRTMVHGTKTDTDKGESEEPGKASRWLRNILKKKDNPGVSVQSPLRGKTAENKTKESVL